MTKGAQNENKRLHVRWVPGLVLLQDDPKGDVFVIGQYARQVGYHRTVKDYTEKELSIILQNVVKITDEVIRRMVAN